MNEQLINVYFYSFIKFILQKSRQSCSHLATVGSRWMLYQIQHKEAELACMDKDRDKYHGYTYGFQYGIAEMLLN